MPSSFLGKLSRPSHNPRRNLQSNQHPDPMKRLTFNAMPFLATVILWLAVILLAVKSI